MSKYKAGKGRTYGFVIKDGHTMTMYDVLKELEDRDILLDKVKELEGRLKIANECLETQGLSIMNNYRRKLNIYLDGDRKNPELLK